MHFRFKNPRGSSYLSLIFVSQVILFQNCGRQFDLKEMASVSPSLNTATGNSSSASATSSTSTSTSTPTSNTSSSASDISVSVSSGISGSTSTSSAVSSSSAIVPSAVVVGRPMLGMTIPNLVPDFTQVSWRPAAENNVRLKMAKKAIADAYYNGGVQISMMLPGYFPNDPSQLDNGLNDLALWQSDPETYWKRIDALVAEITQYGMKITIKDWNSGHMFPSLAGETIRDFITNGNSRSYLLYVKYWTEFVNRYKNNPSILNYSAPGEVNAEANLDIVSRCQTENANNSNKARVCSVRGNFTTDELMAFYYRLVSFYKSLDSRPVNSGTTFPARWAYHIQQNPEWKCNSACWLDDSKEEFTKFLQTMAGPFEQYDVHMYNAVDGKDLQRFGYGTGDPGNVDLLGYASDVIQAMGKKIVITEYGDMYLGSRDTLQFSKNIANSLVKFNIPYASIWSFEFFQFNTYEYQKLDGMNGYYDLDPNFHQDFWKLLAQNNINYGQPSPSIPSSANPKVLITYPYNSTNTFTGSASYSLGLKDTWINGNSLLHVVASAITGTISKVQIAIDGVIVQTLTTPPYRTTISGADAAKGAHTVSVIATDSSGRQSTDSINGIFDGTAAAVKILSAGTGCLDSTCIWVSATGLSAATTVDIRDTYWNIIRSYPASELNVTVGQYPQSVTLKLATANEISKLQLEGLIVTVNSGHGTWDSVPVK